MAKDYQIKRRNKNDVLEWEDTLYVLDEKRSQATISLPFKAITKLGWDKETPLVIQVRKKEDDK